MPPPRVRVLLDLRHCPTVMLNGHRKKAVAAPTVWMIAWKLAVRYSFSFALGGVIALLAAMSILRMSDQPVTLIFGSLPHAAYVAVFGGMQGIWSAWLWSQKPP